MQALATNNPLRCRTAWISDVHLGSVHCKAEQLLALLERLECDRLYLVGDIVDVWAMQRRVFWPESHNRVLRKIMQMSQGSTDVVYVPGNHDHNFREFAGSEFGGVQIQRRAVHLTGKGQRMLVTHGDELDYAVRYSGLNRLLGDLGYGLLMWLTRRINELREATGRPYWSLAGWVKTHVAQADAAIRAYQQAAVALAREQGFDGIICGHLHYPALRQYGDILYCNDGDWVENCTALIEEPCGELRLVRGIAQARQPAELLIATEPAALPEVAR